MKRSFGKFALLVFLCTGISSAAYCAQCDPHSSTLDRAQALIAQSQFDQASRIVSAVLARDHNDFRAQYLSGVIVVDQADLADKPTPQPGSKFSQGLSQLQQTAQRLPQLDRNCTRDKDFYAILNTIGAELINRGRFTEAEQYLLKAKTAGEAGLLSPATKIKVLDNLGLVYLWEQKYSSARKYYSDAQAQGSPVAKYQLQTVDKLRSLTTEVKKP